MGSSDGEGGEMGVWTTVGAAAAPHLSPFQAPEERLARLRCQGPALARELLRDVADGGAHGHWPGLLAGLRQAAGAGGQQLPAQLHRPLHREQLHDCCQKVTPPPPALGTPHLPGEGQTSLQPGTLVVLGPSISCPHPTRFSSPPTDLKPKSVAIAWAGCLPPPLAPLLF